MTTGHERAAFSVDVVAAMMRSVRLPVEEHRLEPIAELLEAATAAAEHLNLGAARVPLEEALQPFDPTWYEEAR